MYMKKQYESPEMVFYRVFIPEDILKVSIDQEIATEIGGDDPPGGGGFGDLDDGGFN